jgi:hypothetical protein
MANRRASLGNLRSSDSTYLCYLIRLIRDPIHQTRAASGHHESIAANVKIVPTVASKGRSRNGGFNGQHRVNMNKFNGVDRTPMESGPRRSDWKRPCYPLGRAAGITFHLRCRLNNGRTAGGKRPNAGRQRHAAGARLCNPDCGYPTRSPADRCVYCANRKATASIAIKPAINNNEVVAAILFALGLSFHDRRP